MVNTSDILPNTPRYLKVPLIFFNVILWILGILLIILGAVVLNALKNVDSLDINVGLSSGLVVLGVFILILTVVGSVVAYKEQLVGLIVYTVIMLVLLICLIGVGAAAFSYRNDTQDVLTKAWTKANNTHDPIAITKLQDYFDCCGWNGTMYADGHLDNQIECITYNNETITNSTTGEEKTILVPVYYPGADCSPIITGYVRDRLYIAGVAGVVIGVIEFVCMFFSLYLIVRLCRNPRSRSYD